jgi:carbamoyl-phosphate synthase large subunit
MIRLLITGAGHPITEGTLTSLRAAAEEPIHIVGVDIPERGRDFAWVDKHFVVAPPGSPEFVSGVLDICRREDIHVVVPWSDDEVEAVARASSEFGQLGVALLCGSHRSVERTVDKGTLLSELSRTDIPTPAFELASSPDEIAQAASMLGYPKKKVVIKPRRESCSRGLWILDREMDLACPYSGPGQQMTLTGFLALLRDVREHGKGTPEYVAMEFLPGQDYSVDALADSGTALFVIPRKRLKAVEGVSQVGQIAPDPAVRAMVSRVIEEFELHLNVNVQLRYSRIDGGEPLVYEINPRISGSIAANDAAGVSLLYRGIQLALGRPVPDPESIRVREGKMVRSWIGRFTPFDRWFTP